MSDMTQGADMDAGKRLSGANKDAELVILLRAVAKGTNHIKSRQSIIFEAAADALERLTANRGSVSEERAWDVLKEKLSELYGVDAGNVILGGLRVWKSEICTAIRQAVSECSGGGACCEGMREKAAKKLFDMFTPLRNGPWEDMTEGVKQYWRDLIADLCLPLPVSADGRDAPKPVCSVYHSRAIGVACSNCGHLKEDHQGGEGK